MSLTVDLAATEEEARTRFEADAKDLRFQVLHDDGLYRHLRLTGTLDRFDIVTWPGRLTIDGGHGTYTFSRQADMFAFFRLHGRGINPSYWSEKLVGHETGRGLAQAYSEDAYRRHVQDAVAEWLEEHYENEAQATSLRAAVHRELLDQDDTFYPGSHHDTAREAVRDFKHRMIHVNAPRFVYADRVLGESWERVENRISWEQTFDFGPDTWEWDLSGWDFHFLWCCWAIRHAIQQYDALPARTNLALVP